MSGDGAGLADCIGAEAAQTRIDVAHEVCLRGYMFDKLSGNPDLFSTPPIPIRYSKTIKAVDFSDLQPRARRKCLSALYRICGRRALLPRSLQIQVCYDRSTVPLYRGGGGDVWKGDYQGMAVAVKVVRVYLTSDLKTITRVCPLLSSIGCPSIHTDTVM